MSQAEIVAFATDDATAIARLLEESRLAVSRSCEGTLASLRSAESFDPPGARWNMFDPPMAGGLISGPHVPGARVRLCAAYWRWLSEREPSLTERVEGIARGAAGESVACRTLALRALGAIDPARSASAIAQALDDFQAAGDAAAISRLACGSSSAFDGEEPVELVKILAREDPERVFALLESDVDRIVRVGVQIVERIHPPGGVGRLVSMLDRPGTRAYLVRALLRMGGEPELTAAFAQRLQSLEDARSINERLQVLESIANEDGHGPEETAARRILAALLESSEPGSVRERVLNELIAKRPAREDEDDDEDDDDDDEGEAEGFGEDEGEVAFVPCDPAEALAILDVLQSEGLIGEEVADRQRRGFAAGVGKPIRQVVVYAALRAEGAFDGLSLFRRRNLDRWFLTLCGRTQGRIQAEAITCPAHRGVVKDDVLQFVAGGRLFRTNLMASKEDVHEPEATVASVLNRILEASGEPRRFLSLGFGDTLAYGDPAAYSRAERRLGFPILARMPDCRIELRATMAECNAAADREFAIRCIGRELNQAGSGAEVLLARDEHGSSMLHHAASSNLTRLIGPIVDAGLPVDVRDGDGLTPLYHAAFYDHLEATLALVGRRADVLSCDGAGLTVLHVAAMKGSLNVARALLDRGFDVDLRLKLVESPPTENASVGSALIKAIGLDVFGEFRAGQTPLHLAAMNGEIEMLEFLLDAGASIDAQDDAGLTPLHLAVSYDEEEAAEFLLARGASTSILDDEGRTADERADDSTLRREETVSRANELIRLLREKLESNDSAAEDDDDPDEAGP